MEDVSPWLDVFSASEIARAARADVRDIRALIAAGGVPTLDGRFVSAHYAVRVVRSIRAGAPLSAASPSLFRPVLSNRPLVRAPFVSSAVGHAVVLTALVLTMGLGPSSPQPAPRTETTGLVFQSIAGIGGGGGGGGLEQPAPASRAELQGTRHMRSPVPTQRVVADPATKPGPVASLDHDLTPSPPPPERQPIPATPVVAPVATIAADAGDRPGSLTDTAPQAPSQGQGTGGGAGEGTGTGLGEGQGGGIGAGSGGGTGGGPFRAGSGITPPSLLHEVKPDYSEEARRRGINGDVELEIVVRSDGTVGDIHLQRGLGAGLDQRAIDAVRQWRFSPAHRSQIPVDVIVEVAVEFKLR